MKSILLALTLTFGATAAAQSPIQPEVSKRLKTIEALVAGSAGLLSGKVVIGSSGNVATARTLTGDVTVGNTGVTAIGAGKVLDAMTADMTAADGLKKLPVARATFDYADGDLAIGAHDLGVSLPAKAVIVRSWIHVITQLADSGTCSYAVSCEDANNIKTSTDLTGTASGGFIEGESTGAASAFKTSIGSACAITGTMTDTSSCVPSAGKGIVYVEYTVDL